MKFLSLIVTTCIFLLSSCKDDKGAIQYFYQKPMAESIITEYERLANIEPINKSKADVEIRYWGGFLRDSFPVGLNRILVNGNNIMLEKYLFYGKDTSGITMLFNKSDKKVKHSVFKRENFENGLADSILQKYNLSTIDAFDMTEMDSLKSKIYSSGDYSYVFIQHKYLTDIKFFFMENPMIFGIAESPSLKKINTVSWFWDSRCFKLNSAQDSSYRMLLYRIFSKH